MKSPAGSRTKPRSPLRARAESRLGAYGSSRLAPAIPDLKRLVHELQVHQTELEMQNEELRRTQRELETARERLALLYDAAPFGYLTIDSTAVIREANSTAADLLGCPHQQLAGQGLSRFVAPESQDAFRIFCGSMLAAEGKRAVELRFRRSDRSTFAGWLETHPEPPTPGEPPRFLLALTDITERMRAQEHLAQLAAIVESSNDAIIGQTLDGVVISWNPASERIFGYSTGEMLGRPFHILVPPDHLDSLQAIGQRIRQGERIEHYDSVRITKDGRRIAVTVTTSPIKDVRGGIVGISTILRDITPHNGLRPRGGRARPRWRASLTKLPWGCSGSRPMAGFCA